ncbi:MAG: transcription-repair coupling factor (superfamily II helicase) [Limisphaerales bacterium]|jgi:transcription-repair coupling factor (superfamily II helicase)
METTIKTLLEHYREDARVLRFRSQLDQAETSKDSPPARLHLEGLLGSASALIASSIFKSRNGSHCFILEDKEQAAYFLNDLQNLLEKKDILFVPDSFKKPGVFKAVNANNVLLRTEAVNRLSHSNTKGELLVTYAEAIFEHIVSPESLEKETIFIKKGERLDADFLIDVLIEHGFEHVDFVYEPGHFSVRGGIVDIFSYGNDLPYRIELFGDEVESIRVFEPESQLSTRKIAQVTIVPNMQTQFDDAQKVAILDSLPKNTLVWFQDLKRVMAVVGDCTIKAAELSKLLRAEKKPDPDHLLVKYSPEDLFTNQEEILAALEKLNIVEFGKSAHLPNSHKIVFATQPQPSFNKNFEMLIAALRKNSKNNFENFLYCSNIRQVERFHAIFLDLAGGKGIDLEYQPVASSLSAGFIDEEAKIACYTDHQIFERYHKYSIRRGYSRSEALTLKALQDLSPGDFVSHIDHGVGTYSGLEKIEVNGHTQEAVRLIYRDNDLLYVPINALHKIAKHVGKDGTEPKINKLGSDAWENLKRRTKKKVKDIARDLIKLYAKRRASKGFEFSPDSYMQNELEASFIYEATPDQEKSTADVKRDMEAQSPMDRLVCGDVGFGKTEIAIRAAFKAVNDSKQVAVLVPTTILAFQHYKTFTERLKDMPCEVDFINRFKTGAKKKETLARLKEGRVDILIGTHGIVSKSVEFKDLGLLIIDEEQKFGVAVKDKLKQIKENVDTLTLTATPIPRTLKFSLMGARDLSIINTPPPNRQPITTELRAFDPELIQEAINFEVYRGGQVFFVHNRVKDIEQISGMIRNLCPDMDIGVAHGQLDGTTLEKRMLDFINRKYDILVCTNIVESGLDIPNANTIIINNAQNFGLSDLHQLRGRVGRSNKKAFCYLFSPPVHTLSTDARKRLRTIEEFSALGSGFNISMRDMDIRGAGNLLGGEQSGFVSDIGFEMYTKILNEAIAELKSTDFKNLFAEEIEREAKFVTDCQIDTDLEMHMPDNYVNNINERLNLYSQLDNIQTEEGLAHFGRMLADRFGPLPLQVQELFNGVRLRWLAVSLGFERIIFKNNKLRCYFVGNQESSYYESKLFAAIIKYVQMHPGSCQMKETRGKLVLTFDEVKSMKRAFEIMKGMASTLGLEKGD